MLWVKVGEAFTLAWGWAEGDTSLQFF